MFGIYRAGWGGELLFIHKAVIKDLYFLNTGLTYFVQFWFNDSKVLCKSNILTSFGNTVCPSCVMGLYTPNKWAHFDLIWYVGISCGVKNAIGSPKL